MSTTVKELYSQLQRCIASCDIVVGREVQRFVAQNGLQSNPFLGSHLIRMFGLCGTLREADEVFDALEPRTIFAWSAIISCHAENGSQRRAFELFQIMQKSEIKPNSYIFVAILKACAASRNLDHGRLVHFQVLIDDFRSDVFVVNSLIDMYAKCGLLEDARSVFSASPEHSVASWTAIISAYSMHSQSEESFQLFVQMRQQGVEANDVTFLCLLKACDSEGFLKEGKLIHNCILQSSFANHIMVGNSIICMYAKCGCLKYALRVFDELPKQNIVTWNAMIHAYGQHGFGHEAFQLFEQMQRHGVNPSQITFASVLKATSHINALKEGQLIHSKIVMLGSEWDAFMVSALIDMYTGCGNIEDALCIFRNSCKHELVTWSAMISGLVHQFHYEEAFMLYQDMLQEDVEPNGVTFVCILKACSALGLLDLGRCIHMFTALSRLESIIEVGNTLIDMYTKTGKIVDALIVFEKMPEKDVISWNAMMYGCTEHNLNAEALLLFSKMQCQGKQFTIVTFLSALRACSDPLFIEWGRLIHFSLVLDCHEADLVIGRTLIDMYARCQSFDDAVMVFHSLSSQNDASWSAIVVACIHCSHIDLALYYFSLMLQQGYSLNKVLFVSLLSACSQKGMADEAFHYFSMMESMYGIIPVLEHYCCVVDTLGRMGSIVEAEDLLKTSPCEMNHTTCAYLLNHCKTYCNVGAEHIYFDNLNFLDHMHVSCYALLPDMQTCWKM